MGKGNSTLPSSMPHLHILIEDAAVLLTTYSSHSAEIQQLEFDSEPQALRTAVSLDHQVRLHVITLKSRLFHSN